MGWEHVGEAFETNVLKSRPSCGRPRQRVGDTYALYYSLSVWDNRPRHRRATGTAGGPFTDHASCHRAESGSTTPSTLTCTCATAPLPFWGSFHGFGVALTAEGWLSPGSRSPSPARFEALTSWSATVPTGCSCPRLLLRGEFSTYEVVVGRADTLEGPYLDREGATGSTATDPGAHRGSASWAGHNAVVRADDGTDWIVYTPSTPSSLRRRRRQPRVLMTDPLI